LRAGPDVRVKTSNAAAATSTASSSDNQLFCDSPSTTADT
jgi:hypothetical protein